MGMVVLDMSMSLDGFIAGTNVDVERPMGDRGERLHDWMYAGKTEREAKLLLSRSPKSSELNARRLRFP